EEGGLGDQDPARAGAPDGAPDLGWVHRPDDAIENEQADGQQNGRLDGAPPAHVRFPASRATVSMARKISCREIFDRPCVRSVKVIGISLIDRSARSQRASSSISAE